MKPTKTMLIAWSSVTGMLGLAAPANAQLAEDEIIGIDFQPTQARASALGTPVTLQTGTNFNVFDIDTDDDGLTIADDGDDLDSTATLAAGTLINTAGVTVSGVSFSLTNNTTQDTLRATFANAGTEGAAPPSLLNEMAVWDDGYISNNQGGSFGIPSGGNFVLVFSGLDDALNYNLEGGWDNNNNNFNMNWAADGQDFTTDVGGAAGAGYGRLTGLRTDGSGNLVITVTEANNPDHVVIGGLTLEAYVEGGDSDGDGLDDLWEDEHFGDNDGNPTIEELARQDGMDDGFPTADGDGATNLQEHDNGSDPNVFDTDGDNLSDGEEINTHGTLPTLADTDDDGLTDKEEVDGTSDPLDPDSDDDGLNDGVEVLIARLSGPMDALQAGTNGGFGSFDGGVPGAGLGTGTIRGGYNTDTELLDFNLTWQDLTSAVTNMHFHEGASGVSGGVLLGVSGPWVSPQTETDISVTGSDRASLLNGDWYLNIHTSNFGGGEIRGQVLVGFTDAVDPDSDDDGVCDGDEVNFVPPSDPLVADDTDGDGIPNAIEDTNLNCVVDAGETDPLNADSDGDNIPDGVEDANQNGIVDGGETSPLLVDTDMDGVNDDVDGDPLDPDQDNDGVLDGADDFPNDPTNDTDGDGIGNDNELLGNDASGNSHGFGPTDPNLIDTDGDHIDDDKEVAGLDQSGNDHGFGATDPNLADSDGDGFDDGDELAYGGDPNTFETELPNAVKGYTATGGDWLSAFASFDIDGDGALGTDGFFFWGSFTGAGQNGQPFSFHVESSPSYIVEFLPGADFRDVTYSSSAYGQIDDPLVQDGTDRGSGFMTVAGTAVGQVNEMFSFEVGSLVVDQVVRVGVFGGNSGNADGRWDPIKLILSGPGGYLKAGVNLEIDPGGTNAGWLFFDIESEGVYTIFGAQRLATQGSAFGGLTFDSAIVAPGPQLRIANAANGTDLEFSWESTPGKLYDIRRNTDLNSSPSTWPIWQADISADMSGMNLETYARPVDPKSFFVLEEKDPPALLEVNFEADNGGFTTTKVEGTDWAWGHPTSSDDGGTPNLGGLVTSGNGGSANCWGTDIGNPGFYADPTTASCLRSPVIDLTGVAAAELTFAHAIDLAPGDSATVNIIDDTTDTVIAADIVAIIDGDDASSDWETIGPVAIPAAAIGQAVRIEWCLTGTGGGSDDYMGWYVDDVFVEE